MKELNLIKAIKEKFSAGKQPSELLVRGIGDDCAVFAGGQKQWLISTDTLVENKHFDLSYHPAEKLGSKAINVNLSDIAAMGGIPRFATISVTIPNTITESWLDLFVDGIHKAVNVFGVELIGGDTVSGTELSVTVTILGEAVRPVYRDGAQPNDSIYVSGYLGSAAGGLFVSQQLYKKGSEIDSVKEDKYRILIESHLNISPQITLGRLLSSYDSVTAMQDISDGIATDLAHIAKESSVKAVIYEDELPIQNELALLSEEYPVEPVELALKGGEDFQLLFTVSGGKQKENELELLCEQQGLTIKKIGRIEQGEGDVVLLKKNGVQENITFQGYQHTS